MSVPEKPRLRGVLHFWAAFAALFAGAALVAIAPSARAAWSAGVYALSAVTLFGVSAGYHRPAWGPRARAWMRRADHAAIFVLIAGTYTPICLLALPAELGHRLVIGVWIAAAAGVAQSMLWISAPKALAALIYIAFGGAMLPFLDVLRAALSRAELLLIVVGGAVYAAGAMAYVFKRPDLKPGVFGYHELFHAATLVAGAMHFSAILLIVRASA